MLALASEDLSLRPGSASVVSVTLIKLLNFSEFQFPHLQGGTDATAADCMT